MPGQAGHDNVFIIFFIIFASSLQGAGEGVLRLPDGNEAGGAEAEMIPSLPDRGNARVGMLSSHSPFIV